MAKYNSTCLLEVNICYQEKTGHVVVADNMTIGNFIPIAINSLLNEKGSTEKYRIIYAGSILKNEILLKDIRLYTASILHIVNMDKKNYLSSKNQSQEFQYSLFNYYVYCYECKDIAPAKLRIKCLECNMCHDFLIDKDHEPKCREDILSYDGNIPGTCNYTRCTGRSAKFEFYCHKHPMKNAVLLKHIFNNSHHYRCITCEEDLNPILIYPCKNGHVMCLDCFKIYCFQYLREKKFRLTSYCYSIRCPDHCDQSFIQEAHHFRILGNIKYDEYQTQATDAYLQNTYSINCPNPHCNECFEAEMNLTEVTCYSCKHKFCRQCSNEAHVGPCGREPVEGSDVYSENEMSQQSASLIHKISKKCPKCEVNIEKNGGCNHMICKCEAEWCWICGKRWSPACVEDHWFD